MSLGFPNQEGGRSSDSGFFHHVGGIFGSGLIGGFVVRQNSPLGMSVIIGGQGGVYDDLIIRDSTTGAAYPVTNPDQQPVVATVDAASGVNPRIDLVVFYIDRNESASQAVYDNSNMTKVKVVAGTPASSPVAPDATAIQASVGAGNPYYVRATISVPASTTTITNGLITNNGALINLPAKFASPDALAYGYTEIGRTTLGSPGDTVTVSSLPVRKYLKLIFFGLNSGQQAPALRFNNDSGANYGRRISVDGGADSTASGATNGLSVTATTNNVFLEVDVTNNATSNKGLRGNGIRYTTGIPSREVYAGTWSNTSDPITRVDIINLGTGDFAAGTELIVLGRN